MTNHYAELQQEASAVAHDLRRQGDERDARIATWVLVGNGAALLSCFNAAIGGSIGNWTTVQPFAFAFLVGLGAVVLSVVLAREATSRCERRLIVLLGAGRQAQICLDYIEKLGRLDRTPEVAQQIAENERCVGAAQAEIEKNGIEPRAEKRLRAAGPIFLLAGAICFGGGCMVAISSGVMAATVVR